jgi:hypothetical protein
VTSASPTLGAAADQARAEVRGLIAGKGHAVDAARLVSERLERAFVASALHRTPALDQALRDLSLVLVGGEGIALGGKSPEAARLILRAVDRALDEA